MAPYDGSNPFNCELQQAGRGTSIPHPEADPLCVEYEPRRLRGPRAVRGYLRRAG